MSGHNRRERRLFRDLREKSVLTCQIQRLSSLMRRLQARAAKRRSNRWQARYTKSILRATAKVEELEPQVLSRAQELRLRVQENLKSQLKRSRRSKSSTRKRSWS